HKAQMYKAQMYKAHSNNKLNIVETLLEENSHYKCDDKLKSSKAYDIEEITKIFQATQNSDFVSGEHEARGTTKPLVDTVLLIYSFFEKWWMGQG
ncbi:unnamed protein product, partial [Heterotrigona itama]